VAAAAAHDLNDELMVILNCVSTSVQLLGPGHPARQYLYELQDAAQRCIWKTNGLLRFSARGGARPRCTPLETLVES